MSKCCHVHIKHFNPDHPKKYHDLFFPLPMPRTDRSPKHQIQLQEPISPTLAPHEHDPELKKSQKLQSNPSSNKQFKKWSWDSCQEAST
ncbi:hypothetical protein EUGRSUZ_C03727 [Eucalyptus grandis]|uniref:Uncharacterized protein n=2 Tax=Eucalyptus grandis TaxID=71139 RepID=A0ACC3LL83_EUCGR|nr:hypothetical protein EUGRSUZ_C03727 [Eucalyptus grandis]